jgi:hypothetical protein
MAPELTTFSGRRPSQNAFELSCFIGLLKEHKVSSYLEVGARDGDTFHEVMLSLPRGSRGVAIDMPGGLWGRVTTQRNLIRACDDLKRRGYKASYLIGDSKSESTITIARMRGPYDAVLIDGDHTYAGVAADWSNYGRFAPLVAFHDIVGVGQQEKVRGCPVEVPRLWAEIKAAGHTVREFADFGSKMGIGVVLRGETP